MENFKSDNHAKTMNPTPDEIEKAVKHLREMQYQIIQVSNTFGDKADLIESLCTQLATAQQELASVNAEAAGMREALVDAKNVTGPGFISDPIGAPGRSHIHLWRIIDAALSTTAGVKLLETKERYEKALELLSDTSKFSFRSDMKPLDRVETIALKALNPTTP